MRIARLEEPIAAPPISNPRQVALLKRFRELVDAHFRSHWSLARYAETLGVTPPTLGRICRTELGESPTSVINERIIREAQRQLAYTEREIKQIAHELRFADSGYFSRYFRKHTGQKPSEFRMAFRRVGCGE